jgi:hypothetical protein
MQDDPRTLLLLLHHHDHPCADAMPDCPLPAPRSVAASLVPRSTRGKREAREVQAAL